MLKINNSKKGAAAMLTVVFMSILLSIVVLGFVRIAISENLQSSDNDLSNRAFYAAEAGLEDAKRAIKQYIDDSSSITLNGANCSPPVDASNPSAYSSSLSVSAQFDIAYTCQLIDITPPNYEAKLAIGETKQIELNSQSNALFDRVVLEWHINADLPDGDGGSPPVRTAKTLPKTSSWSSGGKSYPAMLRLYMFSYPAAGITRNVLNSRVTMAYLNPANTTELTPIDYVATPSQIYGVYNSLCSPGVEQGDYVCTQTINVSGGGANQKMILRLTPQYQATHIRVTLLNAAGATVSFNKGQAIVDVTGRAGDVYRRIETRLDIDSNFAELIFNQAILSADDICKNMVVPEQANSSDYRPNDCDGAY